MSREIYYAKLRRGGMDTSQHVQLRSAFYTEETWQLVDHRWTFVFESSNELASEP